MVTFYELDDNEQPTYPVLFLDTLKVSTIEQTAEQTEARGGKGNSPLIIWDYGKEINVTLEDALFSAKSMAIMFGNGKVETDQFSTLRKTIEWNCPSSDATPPSTFDVKDKTYAFTTYTVYDQATGASVTTYTKNTKYYVTGEVETDNAGTITISSDSFPGTYYITGDTYARSQATGKDEFFQFIIQKAKVQSENTITLEAEGDPSVFNLSLRVLRPTDHKMMYLVKYNMEAED